MLALPEKFFITGTDTEIGKTFVACHLMQQIILDKKIVEGIKPLVSGGLEDIHALDKNSNGSLRLSERYMLGFDEAIAPHIAAEINGKIIDIEKLRHFISRPVACDHLVIEGFGGWLAPISHEYTMADCISSLDIPVILVVGMKLGCINHAILSARSILNSGFRFHGWIANKLPQGMEFCDENIQTISKFIGNPICTVG